MTAVAFGSNILFHKILVDSSIYLALNLVTSGILAMITYFIMTIILKLDIAEQLLSKVKSKIFKNKQIETGEPNL